MQVSIDTACSSALVGVHSGAQHLQKAGVSILAGGINLMLAERTTAAAQVAGMLNLEGRCKTLDAAADGYVRAEACIITRIDPFYPDTRPSRVHSGLGQHDASMGMQGNDISGCVPMQPDIILSGTCVNQDGRSSSLTAPNGPSQQMVIKGGLADAALEPWQVSGLEMHGTGTPLGDPIEVGAATAVLQSGVTPLHMTAAKSRVGHAEPAAGVVGILQASVQLSIGQALSLTHLRTLNPLVGGILSSAAAKGDGRPFLPKQDGPFAAAAAAPGLQEATGINSFAFQVGISPCACATAHQATCKSYSVASKLHNPTNSTVCSGFT